MSLWTKIVLTTIFAVLSTFSGNSDAQEPEDLRAKTQNPVGNIISLPVETTFDFGAPNGTAIISNVQPVVPVTIGQWNLINRTIVPLAYVPGFIQGTPGIPEGATGGSTFGLGDINHTIFLSPTKPGQIIWGVGPSITLPTASKPQLGSEKWSAGPSVVLLTQPRPWTLGILVRQLWSFAGTSHRSDVNQLLVQPFVNYNLEDGWYLTTQPIVTANWQAPDKWTVPIGGGAGKMFKIGNQAINMRLQGYYNAVRPSNAPDWTMMLTFQLVFPR